MFLPFAGVFFQMSEDGYLLLLMLFMAFRSRLVSFGLNVLFILTSNWGARIFKYAVSHIIDLS